MKKAINFFWLSVLTFLFLPNNTQAQLIDAYSYNIGTASTYSITDARPPDPMNNTPKFTEHMSLLFHHKLNEHLELKTGIGASMLGYYLFKDQPTTTGSMGEIVNSTLSAPNLYLDIPVLLHRNFGHGKYKSFVEVGLIYSRYLQTYTIRTLGDDTDVFNTKSDIISASNLFTIASFGVQTNREKKWDFALQANTRFQLNSIYGDLLSERFYNFGISFSLIRQIRDSKPVEEN